MKLNLLFTGNTYKLAKRKYRDAVTESGSGIIATGKAGLANNSDNSNCWILQKLCCLLTGDALPLLMAK